MGFNLNKFLLKMSLVMDHAQTSLKAVMIINASCNALRLLVLPPVPTS